MPAASRDPAKPRPGLDGASADRHAGGCGRSVLANALIVLEDAILHGRLAMEDGLIAEIRASGDEVPPGAADLSGDLLIPGLIDLHTDHLERHYIPRPNVTWDPLMAVLAHDAQIIGAGITTAFDCLALSGVKSGVDRAAAYGPLLHGLTAAAEMGRSAPTTSST